MESYYLSLIGLSMDLSFLCIAAAINHKNRVDSIQIYVYTNAIRFSGSQPYWHVHSVVYNISVHMVRLLISNMNRPIALCIPSPILQSKCPKCLQTCQGELATHELPQVYSSRCASKLNPKQFAYLLCHNLPVLSLLKSTYCSCVS